MKLFRRRSITFAITLLLMLVSFIPILLLGITVYSSYYQQALIRFETESYSNLNTLKTRYLYEMERISYTSLQLTLGETLLLYADTAPAETARRTMLRSELRKQLYNASMVPGIESAYVLLYNQDPVGFYNTDYFEQYPEGMEAVSGRIRTGRDFVFYDVKRDDGVSVIPYVRRLYDTRGQELGLLFVNITEQSLYELYADLQGRYRYLVLNGDGMVVSAADKGLIRTYLDGAGESPGDDAFSYRSSSFAYEVIGEPKSELTFVCYSPKTVIFQELHRFTYLTVGICFLCLAICFAVSILLSRWITEPIRALIGRLIRRKNGEGDAPVAADYPDIGYSRLIELLQNTIDDYYTVQEEKRRAELKALMFQINPHFLYNTLASVVWLCDEGEAQKASDIVKSLSHYFRISISGGEDVIPLRDELSHAENYLKIQRIRYSSSFDSGIECPEELKFLPVPKLILQPLIENAIYHGIKECDRRCRVDIDCHMESNVLRITVTDDAGGMDPGMAQQLNLLLEHGGRGGRVGGIGISNVNERVRLFAGEGSGLHFEVDGDRVGAVIVLRYQNTGRLTDVPAVDRG